MIFNFSSASFRGRSFESVMSIASDSEPRDPVIGPLSLKNVQLCPQNCISPFTEDDALRLREQYPDTAFRLHANARMSGGHLLADLSNYLRYRDYFQEIANVSSVLGAQAYTVHPGAKRSGQPIQKILDNADRLQDQMGVPVGIEGMYPVTAGGGFYFDSWEDYERLLAEDCYFALDLSHANILRTNSGVLNDALLREMAASERCLEIHVSHNNGQKDEHCKFSSPDQYEWMIPIVDSAHHRTVIFYEGDLRRD